MPLSNLKCSDRAELNEIILRSVMTKLTCSYSIGILQPILFNVNDILEEFVKTIMAVFFNAIEHKHKI